jgi:uncharacterized membrane protein
MPLASLYEWLMFLHVLAAMVWVGGLVALLAFGRRTLREGDPGAVARFVGSLRVIGLVLVLGIWMVLDSDAWDFGQTWVWLGLAVLVAAALVGAIFLSRAGLAAERAVQAADTAEALRQLRLWSVGIGVIVALLVVATWDMVFKPG